MKPITVQLTLTAAASFTLALCILFFLPPIGRVFYPRVFTVSTGENIRTIADNLTQEEVIDSPTLFIASSYLWGNKVVAGSYHFLESKSVFSRAKDLYHGEKNSLTKRVLIHEGSNAFEIATAFQGVFPNFSKDEFVVLAIAEHGYLYPDTYFFAEDEEPTPQEVIAIMKETFESKNRDILNDYSGPFSELELITLASIVELEARNYDDRRKIASVLFNRLSADIPLQVDVSFRFINGKGTFDLTKQDLNIDDPHNTYKNKGIPPKPISNPSKQSLQAVVDPYISNYLFFLADKNGVTHFSETHDEHVIKKAKFIRKQ